MLTKMFNNYVTMQGVSSYFVLYFVLDKKYNIKTMGYIFTQHIIIISKRTTKAGSF